MKTIFKTIFVTAILLLAIDASAQNSPVQFGVKAGVNLSNMTEDLKGDAKIGFNAGVTMDYAFTPDLYLMTGLSFSQKGEKDGDLRVNLSYLELPVHIGYKFSITQSTKLVVHIGPYLGYAVDGKYKQDMVSIDAFSEDLEEMMGFRLKRLDYGLGLGVGAEFNKFSVGLGYDLGLCDLIDVKNAALIDDLTGISNPKGKNMNAHLTVGYKF